MPNRPLATHSRLRERKYFDSGDYALSKAGNKEVEVVGQDHPSPNSIPHYVSSPAAAEPPLAKSPSDTAGVAIVDTDSPTSTMVNPSCLATESNSADAPLSAAQAAQGKPEQQKLPTVFGVGPATKDDAASIPPAAAAPGNTPPPRPALARRVSQLAGTQYRVKD
ncbi:hypothetical protein IW138_006085 [Coemansia sp. RSA 986]|nr:hypothetical protein LPJ74_005661 [Coemansia sp. RSA 1843]KAJ2085825.1 hypothetical protein IW138_006085 [Coemansia sp. RSA 986]